MSEDERPTTAGIADAGREADPDTADEPLAHEREGGSEEGELHPLLGDEDSGRFRERWEAVQVRFVDEPRTSVEDADALVAELMQRLAETFAQEREELEGQWSRGEDVSTEDLRLALRRYRSFFERLLSA